MADVPLDRMRALELRYDGPVPAQYLDTPAAARRRRRGVIVLLESQAADFLDAATRCQTAIEDLVFEGDEGDRAAPPLLVAKQRLGVLRDRLSGHVRAAADALREADALRRDLALDPHPLLGITALLAAA